MNIRRAVRADAVTIAGIHVRGWQWGYRGLMPDAFLDALSIEERERGWLERLGPDDQRHTWLLEVVGETRGFVTCGPAADNTPPERTGQIFALYQEAQSAGTGVGKALLLHATNDLLARGFSVAVLWVLETNLHARRFYELAGWSPDGACKEDYHAGHMRRELRYQTLLNAACLDR